MGKMAKVSVAFFFIMLIGIAFCGGLLLGRKTIGTNKKFILKSRLEIQVSPQSKGVLPQGVVLYRFNELPEITTYYMFIDLKEKDILDPYEERDKYNLIVPASAYPAP